MASAPTKRNIKALPQSKLGRSIVGLGTPATAPPALKHMPVPCRPIPPHLANMISGLTPAPTSVKAAVVQSSLAASCRSTAPMPAYLVEMCSGSAQTSTPRPQSQPTSNAAVVIEDGLKKPKSKPMGQSTPAESAFRKGVGEKKAVEREQQQRLKAVEAAEKKKKQAGEEILLRDTLKKQVAGRKEAERVAKGKREVEAKEKALAVEKRKQARSQASKPSAQTQTCSQFPIAAGAQEPLGSGNSNMEMGHTLDNQGAWKVMEIEGTHDAPIDLTDSATAAVYTPAEPSVSVVDLCLQVATSVTADGMGFMEIQSHTMTKEESESSTQAYDKTASFEQSPEWGPTRSIVELSPSHDTELPTSHFSATNGTSITSISLTHTAADDISEHMILRSQKPVAPSSSDHINQVCNTHLIIDEATVSDLENQYTAAQSLLMLMSSMGSVPIPPTAEIEHGVFDGFALEIVAEELTLENSLLSTPPESQPQTAALRRKEDGGEWKELPIHSSSDLPASESPTTMFTVNTGSTYSVKVQNLVYPATSRSVDCISFNSLDATHDGAIYYNDTEVPQREVEPAQRVARDGFVVAVVGTPTWMEHGIATPYLQPTGLSQNPDWNYLEGRNKKVAEETPLPAVLMEAPKPAAPAADMDFEMHGCRDEEEGDDVMEVDLEWHSEWGMDVDDDLSKSESIIIEARYEPAMNQGGGHTPLWLQEGNSTQSVSSAGPNADLDLLAGLNAFYNPTCGKPPETGAPLTTIAAGSIVALEMTLWQHLETRKAAKASELAPSVPVEHELSTNESQRLPNLTHLCGPKRITPITRRPNFYYPTRGPYQNQMTRIRTSWVPRTPRVTIKGPQQGRVDGELRWSLMFWWNRKCPHTVGQPLEKYVNNLSWFVDEERARKNQRLRCRQVPWPTGTTPEQMANGDWDWWTPPEPVAPQHRSGKPIAKEQKWTEESNDDSPHIGQWTTEGVCISIGMFAVAALIDFFLWISAIFL